MKIHEIIIENKLSEEGIAAKALGWLGKNAMKAAPEVKAVAKDVEHEPTFWDKAAAKASNVEKSKAQKASQGLKMEYAVKVLGDDAIDKLKWLNLLDAAGEYLWKKNQLDKQHAAGMSDDEYNKQLATLRGLALTQWIGPKVGMWAANKFAAPIKVLPWLVKKMGFPGEAQLMRTITEATANGALMLFFSSSKGQRWLTDTMGSFITGVGSIPTLASQLYDGVSGGISAATGAVTGGGAHPSGGNPDVDATSTAPAANAPQQGGRQGSAIDPDPNGYGFDSNFSLRDLK